MIATLVKDFPNYILYKCKLVKYLLLAFGGLGTLIPGGYSFAIRNDNRFSWRYHHRGNDWGGFNIIFQSFWDGLLVV